MAPARPDASNAQGSEPESRPVAVVMPLFPRREVAQRQWTPTFVQEEPPRRFRGVSLSLAALCLVAVGGFVFHSRLSAQRLAERLDAGCLDVDDCRALVHTAETTHDHCLIGCAPHEQLVAQARLRFRGALEQAAHQERQRQDDDYERALATRRDSEAARTEQEHQQRLEELDRQHRHELAMVAAETERARQEKAELQANRLAYLQQLSREQRLRRLDACHGQGAACDELALALAEAAPSRQERQQLIDAHERYVTGGPPRARSAVAPAPPNPASEPDNSPATPAPPL